MSEEAAQQTEEETFEIVEDEVTIDEVATEVKESESATEEPKDEPKEDGVQKRFNKITADKYVEKRRADSLQKQLDDLNAKPEEVITKAPQVEDFDDYEKFSNANINYRVSEALKGQAAKNEQGAIDRELDAIQAKYNTRITALNKTDYEEKQLAIPELPPGVANALVEAENGPELIYHLGSHLNVADELAGMTTNQAIMALGKLSATLNKTPNIKPSTAPDPIDPISSGGSISNDDDEGLAGVVYE